MKYNLVIQNCDADGKYMEHSGDYPQELTFAQLVQHEIDEGWQPIGGISITKRCDDINPRFGFIFAQAMVKF